MNRQAWLWLGGGGALGLALLLLFGWPAVGSGWGPASWVVTRGWKPVGYLIVLVGVMVALAVRQLRIEWHARQYRRKARAAKRTPDQKGSAPVVGDHK